MRGVLSLFYGHVGVGTLVHYGWGDQNCAENLSCTTGHTFSCTNKTIQQSSRGSTDWGPKSKPPIGGSVKVFIKTNQLSEFRGGAPGGVGLKKTSGKTAALETEQSGGIGVGILRLVRGLWRALTLRLKNQVFN